MESWAKSHIAIPPNSWKIYLSRVSGASAADDSHESRWRRLREVVRSLESSGKQASVTFGEEDSSGRSYALVTLAPKETQS